MNDKVEKAFLEINNILHPCKVAININNYKDEIKKIINDFEIYEIHELVSLYNINSGNRLIFITTLKMILSEIEDHLYGSIKNKN